MSAYASEYYPQRAADFGVDCPPVLDGKPHELFPCDLESAHAAVQENFCELVKPVEPYVIGGIPAAYNAIGERYSPKAWTAMMDLLPRSRHLLPVEKYTARHMSGFTERVLADGADQLWLEAFTRDEVPPLAFKHATNTVLPYTRGEYEPAQAFLMAWAIGSTGCAHARLTLVQGIYTPPDYKDNSYITPRYGGSTLTPADAEAMVGLSSVHHCK